MSPKARPYPRLASIAGPLKGSVLSLRDDDVVRIGRASENHVCLSDPKVSRLHCEIHKDAENFKIIDLDSRNGTFVNSIPVKRRVLEEADYLEIGDSLFVFLLSEEELELGQRVAALSEGKLEAETTVIIRAGEALTPEPEYRVATPSPGRSSERGLDLLFRISAAISSAQGSATLERCLLEVISETAPAERGAVLLLGDNPGEFKTIFGWDRSSGQHAPVQLSRSLIDRVVQERVGILTNYICEGSDASKDSPGHGPPQTRFVLAAPLIAFNTLRGVIYLETVNAAQQFDHDLLERLTAIGGIVVLPLEYIRRIEWLESENQRLQRHIQIEHNMVGESLPMRELHKWIAKVAPTNSTVLIRGESGTGKELVAHAIHLTSPRAGKPFVPINCAAIPETLLESELFGHEKGAFTGAIAQKKGKLEVADGGTVFLDEIAELAPSLQAKFLRVIQEREFERVGGTRSIKLDVRLIAATNKDLEGLLRAGSFREDLYHRLNVLSVTVPALRERQEDIPLLATYFSARYCQAMNRPVMGISPEARSCLLSYDWPGNIRELENAIERAVVLGSGELILPEDLPDTLLEVSSSVGLPTSKYHESVEDTKKQIILKTLDQTGGNISRAAKLLGLHPNYLHRLIRNLKLRLVPSK
jgi:Nif-specific regulatory protein